MKLLRLFNRAIAWMGGYFWLPCPICGEPFGGHEVTFTAVVVDELDGEHAAYCVCPKEECHREATRRNMLRPSYSIPFPPASLLHSHKTKEQDK